MPRIIVDIQSGIDVSDALHKLSMVVSHGKLSNAGGVEHYTWLTRWSTGLEISVRRKKKGQNSDSFVVQQGKIDA